MDTNKVYKTFQDLDLWQSARQFKLDIYTLVRQLPKEEKFSLTDQLVRAARSIPANIAEGYGRYTYKDQIRFCVQARGSLYEVMNHLIDAYDCGYIVPEVKSEFETKVKNVEKLLNGYIGWLRKVITQEGK